jgi:hypothetical protein
MTTPTTTDALVSRLAALTSLAQRRLEREPLPQDHAAVLAFVRQQPATWGRTLLWRQVEQSEHLLHELNATVSDGLAHRSALAAQREDHHRRLFTSSTPLDTPDAIRAREQVERTLPAVDNEMERLRGPLRDAERWLPILTEHVGRAVAEARRLDLDEARARNAATVTRARAGLEAARRVAHEHDDIAARWEEIIGRPLFDAPPIAWPVISQRKAVEADAP